MLTIVIRTVIVYASVIGAMRLMGKRQVADMQTSELVIALIISEAAALPLENPSRPLLSSLVPVIILVALEITISILMMKSRRFRGVICGHPIVVIQNGKLIKEEMNRLRISYEDILSLLRQQEIFDIESVKFAVIEPNGSLSVMKNDTGDANGTIESEEIKDQLNSLSEEEQEAAQ